MALMWLLIPLALILNVAALWALIEAVDGGQLDAIVRAVCKHPELGALDTRGGQVLAGPDPAPAHVATGEEIELWQLRCC